MERTFAWIGRMSIISRESQISHQILRIFCATFRAQREDLTEPQSAQAFGDISRIILEAWLATICPSLSRGSPHPLAKMTSGFRALYKNFSAGLVVIMLRGAGVLRLSQRARMNLWGNIAKVGDRPVGSVEALKKTQEYLQGYQGLMQRKPHRPTPRLWRG